MSTPDPLSPASNRLTRTGTNHKQLGSPPAIDAWKTAQRTLEVAIQQFVNASSSLDSFCSLSCHTTPSIPLFQSPHDDIGCRIRSLTSRIPDLYQALSVATVTQKRCHHYAVINKLPREVLSHILHLVVRSELQNLHEPNRYDGIPTKVGLCEMARVGSYPSILSAVCRAWRNLVLGTPALWSYIDLMAPEGKTEHSWVRANLFVSRAGSHSLDIRIHGGIFSQPTNEAVEWLAAIMPRVRCLDLSTWFDHTRMMGVLRCWAEHATPGTMKVLSLYSLDLGPHEVLSLTPESTPNGSGLPVSHQTLEEIVCSVTSLTLTGALFDPTNQAYHRLTYLKLNEGSMGTTELRTILANSPQLRVLSFGLRLVGNKVETKLEPVRLHHLETLVYELPVADCPLLRILAPTPSLRKFKISFVYEQVREPKPKELMEFLRSSVITTFCIVAGPSYTHKLLGSLPHLQLLSLEYYHMFELQDWCLLNSKAFPQFRELRLAECDFSVEFLERIRCSYPALALRISNVTMHKGRHEMTTEEYLENLPKTFHDIKCTYSGVVKNWDDHCARQFADIFE